MDAVHPHVHVVAIRQVSAPELPVILLPGRRQPRDVRRTQARRVLAEQHRQRLPEVTRRQTPQIQHRQHLRHLRRPAHVRRQDPAGEPPPVAVPVHPPVVHPRRPDLHRPRPAGHRAGLRPAVADDQPPTVLVAHVVEKVDVLGDLRLEGDRQHPSRALPGHLVQGRQGRHDPRRRSGVVFRLVFGYLQHGWCVLPPGPLSRGVSVVHVEGYATCLTPPIHNFRLYLSPDSSTMRT